MHGAVLAGALEQVQEHGALFRSVRNHGWTSREFQWIVGKRCDFWNSLRKSVGDDEGGGQEDLRKPRGHGTLSSGRAKMLDQDGWSSQVRASPRWVSFRVVTISPSRRSDRMRCP